MRKSITKSLTFDEVRRMGYQEILDAIGVKIDEYVSDRRIESMSREVELIPEVKEKLQQGGGEYPLDFIYKVNLIAMVDCLKTREKTEYAYLYEFYRVFTDSPFYVAEMYFSRTSFIDMAYETVLIDVDPGLSRFGRSRVYFDYANIDIKAIPEHLGYLTGLGERVIRDFCGDDYSGLWNEIFFVLCDYEEKYGTMYTDLLRKIDGFNPNLRISGCSMIVPVTSYVKFLLIIKTVMSIDYGKRLVRNYFYGNGENRENLRRSLLFAFRGMQKNINLQDHICLAKHLFMLKGKFDPECAEEHGNLSDTVNEKVSSSDKGISVTINGNLKDESIRETIMESAKLLTDFLAGKGECSIVIRSSDE